MEIVDRRDTATLLPIINTHVAVGTIVTFLCVCSTTGTNTQHVESYWNRAEMKLKRMRGCHADQIPSYLDEFIWRERHGQTKRQALSNILQNVSVIYPI